MAKDGTRRGGARPGAGRKKKQPVAPVEAVLQNNVVTEAEREDFPQFDRQLYEAKGEFSLSKAENIYFSVYKFVKENGAENRVPKELVELFAVTFTRWGQAEEQITKAGFTAEHPTTGAPCKSPLVDVSNTYSKQAHNYWYSIWAAVKDSEATTEIDDMEDMLD
jgi:hypothetical protein